jgi:hypothetical protein
MLRASLYATMVLASASIPALAEGPVKSAAEGVVQGTEEVGEGVVQGAGQAGKGVAEGTVGVAKGTATVAKKTGKGVWCVVTLGYGC